MNKIYKPINPTTFGKYTCSIRLVEILNEYGDAKISEKIGKLITSYYTGIKEIQHLNVTYDILMISLRNWYLNSIDDMKYLHDLPIKIVTFTENVINTIYKENFKNKKHGIV